MNRYRGRHNERGAALLLAIFSLLLLSAICVAMLYSSMAETSIDANYRDKQAAMYAALAGLQEGRERLNGDIAVPLDLPSLSAPNVIYIINPQNGETIAPWDPNNKYADTELCQENVLGLSGTPNVPCTGPSSLPSGSSWYTVLDDSSSGGNFQSGTAKLALPMGFKWVRISLKANRMTPIPVDATSTSTPGSIICFDGTNQFLLPTTGYNKNCSPTGSSIALQLTDPGSGYTSNPTVTIGPPPSGGVRAQATATIAPPPCPVGEVCSIAITNPGTGYTKVPTVNISGGGGSGAAALAKIVPVTSGPVQSVSLSSAGSPTPGCYPQGYPPAVSFTPSDSGSGAMATAVLSSSPNCINNVSWTGSCSNYSGSFTISTSGGFQANVTVGHGVVSSVAITNPGTGITSAPTSTSGMATQCTAGHANLAFTYTLGYAVSSLTLTNGGSGYTTAPAVTIGAPPLGNQPTATATVAPQTNTGQVVEIDVTNQGVGYSSAPNVTLITAPGDSGSGATAVANIGTPGPQPVQGLTLTNSGGGYTVAPTVTISPPPSGRTAQAIATLVSGTGFPQVLLVTALGEVCPMGNTTCTRAMAQMEIATAGGVTAGWSFPGALVLDGPNPNVSLPNSNPFIVNGNDANSCGETTYAPKAAVGVYNDAATTSVADAVPNGRINNYTGSQVSPDVQNVYASLGTQETTPTGLEDLATAVSSIATNTYPANPVGINQGSASNPVIDVVNGDLTMSGTNTGYGILLVRGTLTFKGDFTWNGVVLVIGSGAGVMDGGGKGTINGSLLVATTKDSSGNLLSSLGSPTINWAGGGGNGITYDHCWVDNLMKKVPYIAPKSAIPLKILSFRTLSY